MLKKIRVDYVCPCGRVIISKRDISTSDLNRTRFWRFFIAGSNNDWVGKIYDYKRTHERVFRIPDRFRKNVKHKNTVIWYTDEIEKNLFEEIEVKQKED